MSVLLVDHCYDFSVLVDHELDMGQKCVRTVNNNVLLGCQPTKLNYWVGSYCEVYMGIPKIFWLSYVRR